MMTTEEMMLISELPNYASFLDASYYLPFSPSTIAKYVGNVEEELGVRLFIRSSKTRELAMTESGKTVVEAIRRMNDDWIYVKRQCEALKNADGSRIRIGSQPRFGNIHEQRIIADFMFRNPTIQLSMIKSTADELIRNMVSGRLDAAIITLNDSLDLAEYFREHGDRISAKKIVSEDEMYVGVCDKYFPGRAEALLRELSEFTFAVPFPRENDIQSALAMQSWRKIAEERGVSLNYIHLQGYDSTVFEMARQGRIAVTTTHIPMAKYEGIRFLRLSDWSGGTGLFFLHCPLNKSRALKRLESCVDAYTAACAAGTGK